MYALIADIFYCCSRKKYVYNLNKQTNYECLFVLITDNLYCCDNLLKKWKSMFIITIKQKPWTYVCSVCRQIVLLQKFVAAGKTMSIITTNKQTMNACLFWLQTGCIVTIIFWSSEKVCLWSQQSNKRWMFLVITYKFDLPSTLSNFFWITKWLTVKYM